MIEAIIFDCYGVLADSQEQLNLPLLELIAGLKKDHKIAILSNANRGLMHRLFSDDQLALFDEIVVSDEVGLIKPNHDIYILTADRLGVEPSGCLFIDDSQSHCAGAEAAGMRAIWYQNLEQFQKDLKKFV